jgi:hypothetical protein
MLAQDIADDLPRVLKPSSAIAEGLKVSALTALTIISAIGSGCRSWRR